MEQSKKSNNTKKNNADSNAKEIAYLRECIKSSDAKYLKAETELYKAEKKAQVNSKAKSDLDRITEYLDSHELYTGKKLLNRILNIHSDLIRCKAMESSDRENVVEIGRQLDRMDPFMLDMDEFDSVRERVTKVIDSYCELHRRLK
jgi:hypothetical protein